MGFASTQHQQPTVLTGGYRLQTSTYKGLTIVYGTQRVPGNIVAIFDFTVTAHNGGGKGFGGGQTNYTYSERILTGLCQGPILGVGRVWRGSGASELLPPYRVAVLYSFMPGTLGQTPESYLVSLHPGFALGYTAMAYAWTPNLEDLGSSTQPTQRSWEVYGLMAGTVATIGGIGSDAGGDFITFTSPVPAIPITIDTFCYDAAANVAQPLIMPAGSSTNTQSKVYLADTTGLTVGDSVRLMAGTSLDANPADIITDILSNQQYALGTVFPSAWVGDMASSYFLANGLLLSMVLDSAQSASATLKKIADITAGDFRWSGSLYQFIPYGDQVVTGNGVTFTPNLTPVYDFGDDDYTPDKESEAPVQITVKQSYSDQFNRIGVEFLNRANDYDPETVYRELPDDIQNSGVRAATVEQYHEICDPLVGTTVAQMRLQRQFTVVNEYRFKVDARYFLLDALDIVSLTDSLTGLDTLPVRIVSIIEAAKDYKLDIIAEDLGVTTAQLYPAQSRKGVVVGGGGAVPVSININPIIFEPSTALAKASNAYGEIWFACSGQNANEDWGGCDIYYSAETPSGTGSITSGTATLTMSTSFTAWGDGDMITVAGAGPAGADLTATILNISGSTLTLDTNASTTVSGATVTHPQTFNQIGTINGPATMGTLSATLASHSDPDTVDTLSVDLSTSGGVLVGITHGQANKFHNLSYVDGEFVAFSDVASTGTNTYDLTYLRRGLYKSAIGSHSSGTNFTWIGLAAKPDPAIFRWPYPTEIVGDTIYLKFTSFNESGQVVEDLSTVDTYTFTIAGTSLKGSAKNEVTTSTGLTRGIFVTIATVTISANSPSDIIRFSGSSTLAMTSFNTSVDEVDGRILVDGATALPTSPGQFPVNLSVASGPSSNPTMSAAMPYITYVPGDTQPHTYALQVKLNSSGSLAGSATYALLEAEDIANFTGSA